MPYNTTNDFPEQNCAANILCWPSQDKTFNTPNITTFAWFANWQWFTNYTEETLDHMRHNVTCNSSRTNQEGWLVWPLDTNRCQAHFLSITKGLMINRPGLRYVQRWRVGGAHLFLLLSQFFLWKTQTNCLVVLQCYTCCQTKCLVKKSYYKYGNLSALCTIHWVVTEPTSLIQI